MTNRRFRFSRMAFRLLRRFLPADIRTRYGDELEEYFIGTLEAETARIGWYGFPYVWLNTLFDVLLRGRHWPYDHPAPTRPRGWVHGLRDDLRFGLRSARRNAASSASVTITLTVGLGASIAMFTLFNGVLLRPLPFPKSTQLVTAWSQNPELGLEREGSSPADVLDWDASNTTLESMAAWYTTSVTYQEENYAEQLIAAQTTGDFFRVLGVRATLGNTYTTSDLVSSHGPAVISHALWQRRFGADPSIVGRGIRIRGETIQVVGIMPPDFAFPARNVDLWLAWDPRLGYAHLNEIPRTSRFLNVVGRLRPGVNVDVAESDLQSFSAQIASLYPTSNNGWSVRLNSLYDETVATARPGLILGLGAVGFLLILTCVNVANMLLARFPQRTAEFAVRSAIGADRFRLIRQLLTEVGILVTAATVFALGIAFALVRLVIHLNATSLPRVESLTVDGAVVAFSVTSAAAVTLLCGVAPVLHATRNCSAVHGHRNRIGDTKQHQRVRQALVIAQLAIAATLLVGAGLFSESFRQLRASDLGFDDTNVLTYRLALNARTGDPGYIQRYYRGVIDSMSALPGVVSAGASTALPLDPVGNDFNRPFRLAGEQTTSADAEKGQMRIVSSGFFAAVGQSFRFGNTFSGREREDQDHVAIINRTLAEKMWPGNTAVSQVMEIDFRDGWQPYTIIGVVNDIKHYGARSDAVPEIFVPATQIPYLAMSIALRTENSPELLEAAIRRVLFDINAQHPPHQFRTLKQLRADSVGEDRFLLMVFGVFGVVALTLAATGVYGLISYTIVQRRREVGIRMALGAHPARLARTIMQQTTVMATAGLAIGLVAAWQMSTLIEGVLYLVDGNSPAVLAIVGIVLFAIVLIAATFPTRRLIQIEPTEALRPE